MKRLIGDEKGAAMFLVLILLLIGGLITTPLLAHMGTGLIGGEVYERRADELYAADAGVEDAIWKIQHQAGYLPCNPSSPPRAYNITDVNGKSVHVTIDYQDGETYRINSIAITDDGGGTAAIDSSTTVEAYIEIMVFDLFAGALVSMSDIDFSKDCSVSGDIYYVGEITGQEYEHIDGEEIQVPLSAFPTPEQNEAFAQQFKDEALVGGTHPGDMTIDSDRDLGPLYITGNLYVEDKVQLNLEGTIYVEGTIDFKKDSEVTGSGSIVAVGDIYLSKLPDYGIEGDSIIMSLNGDITFKKEASIEALVYAPNGYINIDKAMTVTGGVIGANINVDKEGSFTYVSKSSSFGFPLAVPYGAEIKTYNISQN